MPAGFTNHSFIVSSQPFTFKIQAKSLILHPFCLNVEPFRFIDEPFCMKIHPFCMKTTLFGWTLSLKGSFVNHRAPIILF